MALNLKSTPN